MKAKRLVCNLILKVQNVNEKNDYCKAEDLSVFYEDAAPLQRFNKTKTVIKDNKIAANRNKFYLQKIYSFM